MWTLHDKSGVKVGGPYKDHHRARAALDKKDNEYGGYVHSLKPLDETKVHAQHINAVANLMQEKRLTQKADNLHKVGVEAEKIENASQGYKNVHDKLSRKPSVYGE